MHSLRGGATARQTLRSMLYVRGVVAEDDTSPPRNYLHGILIPAFMNETGGGALGEACFTRRTSNHRPSGRNSRFASLIKYTLKTRSDYRIPEIKIYRKIDCSSFFIPFIPALGLKVLTDGYLLTIFNYPSSGEMIFTRAN